MSTAAFYPEPLSIEAYGNGGFRFGEMSHKGSLLILPSGVYAWPYASFDELDETSFEDVFQIAENIPFLLLGTGVAQVFPDAGILNRFQSSQISLEVMDTGAAARTFNILLGEGRAVAAALLAVE